MSEMKHKLLYSILSVCTLTVFFGCNQSESDLLKPKLYFENKEIKVEVEDVDIYSFEVTSRLSNKLNQDVNIEYQIGDESYVEIYNKSHGTSYAYMPTANFSLDKTTSVITSGNIFADPCMVSMKNLLGMEEGNSYLIPIILQGQGAEMLAGSDITYVVVRKPITINKVYDFNGNYLDIKLPSFTKNTTSVTYEALIYADIHVKLSTIMGNEGILLFRFGDTTVDADQIQIAGKVQFNPVMKFDAKKWYHVAFTYDASSQMAAIYVNGEKLIDKAAGQQTFDLNERFCIGYAYDYDPSRTWRGKMSECRIWTVARTANQLSENMMGVDPNSEGLLGYWKLNGSDYEKRGDEYYVKDQSKNGLDALSFRGRRGEAGGWKGNSVEPNVMDMKVKLD